MRLSYELGFFNVVLSCSDATVNKTINYAHSYPCCCILTTNNNDLIGNNIYVIERRPIVNHNIFC